MISEPSPEGKSPTGTSIPAGTDWPVGFCVLDQYFNGPPPQELPLWCDACMYSGTQCRLSEALGDAYQLAGHDIFP